MPLRAFSILFLAASAHSQAVSAQAATLAELQSLQGEAFYSFQLTASVGEGTPEGICYKVIIGEAVLAISSGAPRTKLTIDQLYVVGANAAAKLESGTVSCPAYQDGTGCCSPSGMGFDETDGFDYFANWDEQGPVPNENDSEYAAYAGNYLWNNYFSEQGASFVDRDTGLVTEANGPGPWIIAHLDQFTAPGHTYTSICAADANPLATSIFRDALYCSTEADLPVNWGAGEWDHWPCPLIGTLDTSPETINDGSECEEESCYATPNTGKYPTEKLGCYKCGERHGRVGYVYLQFTDDLSLLGPLGTSRTVAYHAVQRWEAMEADDNAARQPPLTSPFQSCSYQFMITMPRFPSPAAPPPPPPPPPAVKVRKDPHLHLAHGGRADLRGEDGAVFNFLSARNVSMNLKTEAADFKWSHRVVHGTRLSAVYWTIRTNANHVLEIEYDAAFADRTTVRNLNDTKAGQRSIANTLREGSKGNSYGTTYWLDNVLVKMADHTLTVTVENKWHMTVKQSTFPFAKLNQKKSLLDVSALALYDADHDVVAPHGLFGQSYDGDNLAVDGKVDERSGDETTTEAQAEGAIEGVYTDYMIDPNNPFSTAFKYSRFDSLAAKPRDVSKLTGTKRARGSSQSAIASADDVPTDAKQ